MGSSNSKRFDPVTAVAGHRRSYSRSVFQTSCIPQVPAYPCSSDIDDNNIDHKQVSDHQSKENSARNDTSKLEGKMEQDKSLEVERVDERTCVSSEVNFRDESSLSDNGSTAIAIQELAGDTNNNGVKTKENDTQWPLESNTPVSGPPSAAFPVGSPLGPLQPEREVMDASEAREAGSHTANETRMISTTSAGRYPYILYDTQDFDDEIERAREIGYHYLLEHTSNFLERRRRMRPQICALLQRRSHFENQTGHDRSCILSGQYERGQCGCRLNNQDPRNGTNAMGGMSRIVYMAEALFEVMDEIHEQSLSFLSRPSLPSARSVPAPFEAVEALSVKPYSKSPKQFNKEDPQCYICLAEYEDGDEVRVLPCRHEFHKVCIDKWLMKSHRVCPLCRGDICKSGSSCAEG